MTDTSARDATDEQSRRFIADCDRAELIARLRATNAFKLTRIAMDLMADAADMLEQDALAHPAVAVPDDVRRLSEAATQGEWSLGRIEGGYQQIDAAGLPKGPPLDRNTRWTWLGQFAVETDHGLSASGQANGALAVAAVNFVRTLLATPAAQQTPVPAAATDALVDRFSDALKAKLRAAEEKYGWQSGWLKDDWSEDCQRDLARHVQKGDPLDVAAYAAFCWHHGWSTAVPAAASGVGQVSAYVIVDPAGVPYWPSVNTDQQAAWQRTFYLHDPVTLAGHRQAGWSCASVCLARTAPDPAIPGPGAGDDETWETIAKWCEETFGPVAPERVAERAAEEMDELLADPTRVEEAADVVIVLSRYPGLWQAVERKMAINRARKWRLMGDGTGYHVPAEGAATRPAQPAATPGTSDGLRNNPHRTDAEKYNDAVRTLGAAEQPPLFDRLHAIADLIEMAWMPNKCGQAADAIRQAAVIASAPEQGVGQRPNWVDRCAWIADTLIDLFPHDPELQPERADPDDAVASLGLPHLLFMALELRDRKIDGETKSCRWLGWLQAGLVACRVATLEDMKQLNLASGKSAAPAPSHEEA